MVSGEVVFLKTAVRVETVPGGKSSSREKLRGGEGLEGGRERGMEGEREGGKERGRIKGGRKGGREREGG